MRKFRGYYLASLISACLATIAFVRESVALTLDMMIDAFVDLFRPEPPRLVNESPDINLVETRASLPASLLERLRHEKGQPNIRAARGI